MDSSIARERIASVVKPDSITASQGDFLATHVSLKKLHLLNKFLLSPDGGRDYTEDYVYEHFVLNRDNRHQFIAVYGQSGTGKSHLIRWFEAKFQYDKQENEVVLFIRRSDNTLKGTIRQLLNTPEVQQIANREIFERLVKATVHEDENKLKGHIYHDLINEIEHDDDSHDIRLANVKRKRLVAFLNNDIVQKHLMDLNGPIERIYSKVAENSSVDRDTIAQFVPEDFLVSADWYEEILNTGADRKAENMARELMADDTGMQTAQKAAEYLNQFVNDVIQLCAGIEPGDFRDIFQDIRRELYRIGKNLTLFIEDVTSFTGVDDALLDALIVEHTGMNAGEHLCRISSVVGTTSNYLKNHFRDNHKDRITQYIYIPDDVFDENGLYEFVGRYINAMSLQEETINSWLDNSHASAEEYPIHRVKEGACWEFVPIQYGKELCLYPFTKNSIRYFYKYSLTNGHQTPRYIIRDIIEPVVNDVLADAGSFPSIKYTLMNVNTTLSYRIQSEVGEEKADRLLRFLTIWGDGTPQQYTTADGITYISAVRAEILDELGFPRISMVEAAVPVQPEQQDLSTATTQVESSSEQEAQFDISTKAYHHVDQANEELTKWRNGHPLDLSTTVGVGGILRKAQEDIWDYLYSAINWGTEEISLDNISKIKKSSMRLVLFENQMKTRSNGFIMMPASWDSMNVISAFIRWREYGKQSWNYPDAEFDAYLVTSWTARIKDELVKAVSENSISEANYIEAAIAAEIYRMILNGEFREKSLKNLGLEYLFNSKSPKTAKTNHTKEWNSLISVMSQKDAAAKNRETVRQYFNLPQGGTSSSILVLDAPNLSRAFRRVKGNRLAMPEGAETIQDPVKPRQEVFSYLREILDRVGQVAKAELSNASTVIQQIYDYFDTDEVDKDLIVELANRVKAFYDAINDNHFSATYYQTDLVRKNAEAISKAINDIGNILEEDDALTIIMAFSGDPLSALQPLQEMFKQLDIDLQKIDRQLIARKSQFSGDAECNSQGAQYESDVQSLDDALDLFGRKAVS